MSIFDKNLSKAKKESLELAEDSREKEWQRPSFVSSLFQGKLLWDLIHPFPEQDREEKQKADEFIKKVEEFLKINLDPDEVDKTREIPQKVIDGLFEMGVFAVKIPKEYGGLGFSQVSYSRLVHLVASYCGSTAALISAHQSIGVPQPLILFGTKEQKKKYLPKFCQGTISGFALTEEDAGSDPRLLKTVATPTDDGKNYLLNGEKLWCTNGLVADVLVVMAYTPPKIVDGKEKKQITAFIVETKTPGVEFTYRCDFMGLKAIQNGLIKFTNVKVPKENIVLGEGEGLKLAFMTLNTGRLTLPAAVGGTSKWCVYVARKWAVERKQWGGAIGDHEAIAGKISTMAADTFAMDAMNWLVAHLADNKTADIRMEAAMVKLFCTEESWKIVNHCLQIRGGSGYETALSLKGRGKPAYAVERVLRDSRVNTILEGSSEIMHLFIAREALDFHLKAMMALFLAKVSPIQKIGVLLKAAVKYTFWYPKLWLPVLCSCKYNLPNSLGKHLQFVESQARRLARCVFHNMLLYQKKLVDKQNIINRLVDIGTDLFAMACVCSYADNLAKKEKSKNAIELAELYCSQRRERIKNNFRQGQGNQDKLLNQLAKKILKGEYAWLEDDIINPDFAIK